MKRKSPGEWKPVILATALQVAQGGLALVTLRGIARRCEISHKQVAVSFGTVEDLRAAVAAEAVRTGDRAVMGRLVIDKHPAVENLPGDVRSACVEALAG